MTTSSGTAARATPAFTGLRGAPDWSSATFVGSRKAPGGDRPPLPIGKLTGVPPQVQKALKGRRITTCPRLLEAAGEAPRRAALATELGLDPGVLLGLVRRADLARVKGLGAVFRIMLEDLGVRDVPALAAQDPAGLHARLRARNRGERLARRSPTPGEVEDWVGQARALPPLVGY